MEIIWNRRVLNLEWNSECVMEGETGEQVEGEDEQVGNARNSSHSLFVSCLSVYLLLYISLPLISPSVSVVMGFLK